MKKFQFVALALAALAIIACKPKNEPASDKTSGGGEGGDDLVFASLINVHDGTTSDWDKVPAEYLKEAVCNPECSRFQALKSVKVYADYMYINVLAEYDPTYWAGGSDAWSNFHMYLDADGSIKTGGYGDEFADADSEWMLEDAFLAAGAAHTYDPSLWKWWGAVNANGWLWTDPSTTHDATDGYGAIIPTGQGGIGSSQSLEGRKIEIQIMREAMTDGVWANTFGIGFDTQFAYTSNGVLPNAGDVASNPVNAPKLRVTIDQTFYTEE